MKKKGRRDYKHNIYFDGGRLKTLAGARQHVRQHPISIISVGTKGAQGEKKHSRERGPKAASGIQKRNRRERIKMALLVSG